MRLRYRCRKSTHDASESKHWRSSSVNKVVINARRFGKCKDWRGNVDHRKRESAERRIQDHNSPKEKAILRQQTTTSPITLDWKFIAWCGCAFACACLVQHYSGDLFATQIVYWKINSKLKLTSGGWCSLDIATDDFYDFGSLLRQVTCVLYLCAWLRSCTFLPCRIIKICKLYDHAHCGFFSVIYFYYY